MSCGEATGEIFQGDRVLSGRRSRHRCSPGASSWWPSLWPCMPRCWYTSPVLLPAIRRPRLWCGSIASSSSRSPRLRRRCPYVVHSAPRRVRRLPLPTPGRARCRSSRPLRMRLAALLGPLPPVPISTLPRSGLPMRRRRSRDLRPAPARFGSRGGSTCLVATRRSSKDSMCGKHRASRIGCSARRPCCSVAAGRRPATTSASASSGPGPGWPATWTWNACGACARTEPPVPVHLRKRARAPFGALEAKSPGAAQRVPRMLRSGPVWAA